MPDTKKSTKTGAVQLTLREQLLGRLSEDDMAKKREVSVMTRMSGDIVEILDSLVELEIFKSRSEAVSAFVEQAIAGRSQMYDQIKVQAADIRKLRDSAKKHAFEALRDK